MAAKAKTRDKAPSAPGPKSDVYVGMLALALIAQIVGAAFLWLDYSGYPDKTAPKVPDRPRLEVAPAGGGAPEAPPAKDKEKDKAPA